MGETMSENKRFKEQNLENHLNRIYDAKKGKVVFDEDVLGLLNDLNNENEQLKQQVKSKERLIEAYEQYINDLKEDGVLDD